MFLAVATSTFFPAGVAAQAPPITSIAFTPDGQSIVAGSQAGLQIFSWPKLELQKSVKAAPRNLNVVAFSPDGSQLAVGGGLPSETGLVEIFSWPALKSVSNLTGHDDSITALAWQGKSTLFSASLDHTVLKWDLATGSRTSTCQGHSRGVSALCLLEADQSIVTASHDDSLRVWNSQTGTLIRSLSQHTKPVNAIALCPGKADRPMIASAGSDHTIRFWQPTIGRMLRSIRLDSEPLDIAWFNASLVIACGVDGQVRVINSGDLKLVATLPGIEGWAYAIACHPDDRSIAVAGSEGQIRRIVLESQIE